MARPWLLTALLALPLLSRAAPAADQDDSCPTIKAPSDDETKLFDTLLARFNRVKAVDAVMKSCGDDRKQACPPADDAIRSFTGNVDVDLGCGVTARIRTKLNAWAACGELEGQYWWMTDGEEKIGSPRVLEFNNLLMLDSEALWQSDRNRGDPGKASTVGLFYHELLHGQLLIDAMKGKDWKRKYCDKEEGFDMLEASDPTHMKIEPAHKAFDAALLKYVEGKNYDWDPKPAAKPVPAAKASGATGSTGPVQPKKR